MRSVLSAMACKSSARFRDRNAMRSPSQARRVLQRSFVPPRSYDRTSLACPGTAPEPAADGRTALCGGVLVLRIASPSHRRPRRLRPRSRARSRCRVRRRRERRPLRRVRRPGRRTYPAEATEKVLCVSTTTAPPSVRISCSTTRGYGRFALGPKSQRSRVDRGVGHPRAAESRATSIEWFAGVRR